MEVGRLVLEFRGRSADALWLGELQHINAIVQAGAHITSSPLMSRCLAYKEDSSVLLAPCGNHHFSTAAGSSCLLCVTLHAG